VWRFAQPSTEAGRPNRSRRYRLARLAKTTRAPALHVIHNAVCVWCRMHAFPDELDSLARIFAAWSAPAPASVVYLFGSRVRGDHRPDSDVDFHLHYASPVDIATALWATDQHGTDFAVLRPLLPGPLGLLDPQDKVAASHVMKARMVHGHANVRCMWLPRRGDGPRWL
jgi:hypothetical protein